MQIFTFMHPRDLLNLARTSKPFRAFLMSRSAKSVWRASMERIEGLPKCPSHMAEPAFVNLLFFSHCHVSPFVFQPKNTPTKARNYRIV